MLVRLPLGRSVFGPEEISRLVRAYEATLCTITEDLRVPRLSSRDIRLRVASAIIAAARQGQLDPDRLKAAALASLVEGLSGSRARDVARRADEIESTFQPAAMFLDAVPGFSASSHGAL